MDSSILDIDELLQDDSFILLAEDEAITSATNVLKQWRLNSERDALAVAAAAATTATTATVTGSAAGNSAFYTNPKLVDTRTFTRPKKQRTPFLNETITLLHESPPPSQQNTTMVNLQIGGLVTTTPKPDPAMASFAMTHSSMQKSLIGDTSPPSSICSTNVEMSASATPNTMMMMMGGSGNSLITSNDFANENMFFLAPTANGSDDTVTKPSSYNGYNMEDVMKDRDFLQNLTFSGQTAVTEPANKTVVLCKDDATTAAAINGDQSFESGAKGTFRLNGTTTVDRTVVLATECPAIEDNTHNEPNCTFNLKEPLNVTIESNGNGTDKHRSVTEIVVEEDDIQLQFRDRDSFVQSTPICKNKLKLSDVFESSPTGNDDLYKTIQLNKKNSRQVLDVMPPSQSDEENDREKEVADEKLLVDILSQTIALERMEDQDEHLTVEVREKMPVPIDMLRDDERQSLTNFEEYEKSMQLLDDNKCERDFDQMLDSLNNIEMKRSSERMRQSLDSIKKRHSLINYEKQQEELRRKVNHIDQEINNLTMETSGSASRLLSRRSRLFDDTENIMSRTINLSEPIRTDGTLPEEGERLEAGNETVTVAKQGQSRRENRDRFKTIKITRKSGNSNIPDADETNIETDYVVAEVFQEPPKPVLVKPSRILARPKFTSGLMRPSQLNITAQKSSSADDLLDSHEEERQVNRMRGVQGKLKSPMGIKSKSIHNLALNGVSNNFQSNSKLGRFQNEKTLQGSNSNLRQMRPSLAPKPASVSLDYKSNVNLRTTKSTGGGQQRPVSAVLGYQARRTESNLESGRHSPVNPTLPPPQPPQVSETARPALARPSGLRPPSGIARPTTAPRSGLPKFSGIPRR